MQTKRQSLNEVVTSYAIGFVTALATQMLLARFYDMGTTAGQDVAITLIFTVVSVVRSYLVRRYFNWRQHG